MEHTALMELLSGAGIDKVVMPKKAFVKEHKHLVKILEPVVKERDKQAKELKEMVGGSAASGFVARMMAENKLKHKGKPYGPNPSASSYKNPTAPLAKGSKMNWPVSFDLKKLANSTQNGSNNATYGASPFIVKHFANATPTEDYDLSESQEQSVARRAWRRKGKPARVVEEPKPKEPEKPKEGPKPKNSYDRIKTKLFLDLTRFGVKSRVILEDAIKKNKHTLTGDEKRLLLQRDSPDELAGEYLAKVESKDPVADKAVAARVIELKGRSYPRDELERQLEIAKEETRTEKNPRARELAARDASAIKLVLEAFA